MAMTSWQLLVSTNFKGHLASPGHRHVVSFPATARGSVGRARAALRALSLESSGLSKVPSTSPRGQLTPQWAEFSPLLATYPL